ncbi:winged helix DNA-binding domain-containing protein [Flavitalea flava]
MTSNDIAQLRLVSQQIMETRFSRPADLIGWMGCIQAQDYDEAKWAIGNRLKDITEAEIDRDFNEGKILRTHMLRPAWHFVLPSDLGWILTLTSPTIKAFNKNLHHKLGIGDYLLKRSKNIFSKALAGGKQLTRPELLAALKKERIETDELRINFLLMEAELDGIICSGGRQGKQFTYALLEERVPNLKYPGKEAAIALLTNRYFVSRGPATLCDFSTWSGLALSDAKRGLEMNKKELIYSVVNGQAYWFAADLPILPAGRTSLQLLPVSDEFTVAYKDHSDILQLRPSKPSGRDFQNDLFKPVLVIDGQIAGTWDHKINQAGTFVIPHPFITLNKSAYPLIVKAARKYANFTGNALAGIM